jgi:hypothetical protein
MNRVLMLVVGGVVAVFSAGLLGVAVVAGHGDLLESDIAWFAPYLGTGGAIAAGIGLVVAAVLLGIGMGRWEDPRPVPTSAARRHEGLQE